jgi:hypothetical protein
MLKGWNAVPICHEMQAVCLLVLFAGTQILTLNTDPQLLTLIHLADARQPFCAEPLTTRQLAMM